MKTSAKVLLLIFALAPHLLIFSGCSTTGVAILPPETSSIPETTPATIESTIPETTEPEISVPETTIPAAEATESSAPTSPTEDTAPPETTNPETEPIQDQGTIYTLAELNAMDTKLWSYGPGRTSDGQRPYVSIQTQETYQDFGVNFIGPDNGSLYLTFDAGYENGFTPDILRTLKANNVKAVFFVTLSYCERNPQLVQQILDDGHILGNHSNHHYSMPTLSIDEMVFEIMSLHEYVKEHFGYEMKLFRPPMGEYSQQSLAVTQNLGYETVHWSFAYQDWLTDQQPDHEEAFQRITTSAHSGGIYLLHAVSETNTAILGKVIDTLREQGYSLDLFPTT